MDDLPQFWELPSGLKHPNLAKAPKFETMLARRSQWQERIHQELRTNGTLAAEQPAGKAFIDAVRRERKEPTLYGSVCDGADYERLMQLGKALSHASKGLAAWSAAAGEMRQSLAGIYRT